MLESEGVGFDDDGCVVMEEFQWDGRAEDAPDGTDWEDVLAEWEIHDCERCERVRGRQEEGCSQRYRKSFSEGREHEYRK